MKVACVVVTYNRKIELLKNIKSIFKQNFIVDKYYIIDNHSNDETQKFLKDNNVFNNKKIEYMYLPENIGGSGGFYTGVKKAYEDKNDFIILMDDDGRPLNNDMIGNLVKLAKEKYKENKLLFLNSLVLDFDNKKLSFGLKKNIRNYEDALNNSVNNLIIGCVNPFNGTLITKDLIEKIGFPNKDFFIKGDETDYLNRAKKEKALVATVCDSLYNHPYLKRIEGKFLGKKVFFNTESPWKEYYRARNYTYMFKTNGQKKEMHRAIIKQLYSAIKYNEKKIETTKMILKGYSDGLKEKLGPTVRP